MSPSRLLGIEFAVSGRLGGGARSGADAYAKLRAGANLVQLYTALAFDGPALIARIKRELAALMTRDDFRRQAGLGMQSGALRSYP